MIPFGIARGERLGGLGVHLSPVGRPSNSRTIDHSPLKYSSYGVPQKDMGGDVAAVASVGGRQGNVVGRSATNLDRKGDGLAQRSGKALSSRTAGTSESSGSDHSLS